MYPYYSHLGFVIINRNEKYNDTNKEEFISFYHLIKRLLPVNCPEDDYVMYNVNIIRRKHKLVTHSKNAMIPVDFFEKYKYVISVTSDDMVSKFE